jgi:hypothetical protein
MKKMVMVLMVLLTTNFAQAADSSWLLCSGTALFDGEEVQLAVNSYEHRNGISESGEQKRINEITLIYGSFVLTGSFDSSDLLEGNVDLKNTDGDSHFQGFVSIEYSNKNLMSLKGNLKFADSTFSLAASQLACKEMN